MQEWSIWPTQGERVCFKNAKYILHEILDWRAWEGSARQHSWFGPTRVDSSWSGLNLLCYTAQPFLAFQSRISWKIYLESLKHTRCLCVSPIDHSCNFIYKFLSVLWLVTHSCILMICRYGFLAVHLFFFPKFYWKMALLIDWHILRRISVDKCRH